MARIDSKSRFRTLYEVVHRWQRGTKRVLLQEIFDKRVQDTFKLEDSLSGSTTFISPNIIADISFLMHGRFVDMNVGRGRPIGHTRVMSKARLKDKKWYSPAYYGRLSKLHAAIGYTLIEDIRTSMKSIEKP